MRRKPHLQRTLAWLQTDINDKPPDPSAAPPAARMKPRPKPWERGAAGSLASSLGGAGGSSSSLGSLPAGGAAVAGPAAADADATAAERGGPAAAALQDASPRAPPAAEPVLLQAPSPVRAPSPSEQAGGAVQAAGSVGDQEAQRGAEQAPAGAVGSGSSFQSPRRAASIYDAGKREGGGVAPACLSSRDPGMQATLQPPGPCCAAVRGLGVCVLTAHRMAWPLSCQGASWPTPADPHPLQSPPPLTPRTSSLAGCPQRDPTTWGAAPAAALWGEGLPSQLLLASRRAQAAAATLPQFWQRRRSGRHPRAAAWMDR